MECGWTIKFWYDAHRAHGVIGYALFFMIFALLLRNSCSTHSPIGPSSGDPRWTLSRWQRATSAEFKREGFLFIEDQEIRGNEIRWRAWMEIAAMAEIKVEGLHKEFGVGEDKVVALENVNLDIGGHVFVSIVGPSGCGKSTLLNILSGIETPSRQGHHHPGQPAPSPATCSRRRVCCPGGR